MARTARKTETPAVETETVETPAPAADAPKATRTRKPKATPVATDPSADLAELRKAIKEAKKAGDDATRKGLIAQREALILANPHLDDRKHPKGTRKTLALAEAAVKAEGAAELVAELANAVAERAAAGIATELPEDAKALLPAEPSTEDLLTALITATPEGAALADSGRLIVARVA